MDLTLRDALTRMRDLLRAGQPHETIALGQRVLHSFPKQIEAFRLLGEAALDVDDWDGAAEMFQRVLSADPENVVAFVGLALIYEHRQDLPAAVWHIERAFELSPTSAEIRRECSRLQGQAGVAGTRLKLTPAALGRLYVLQELYAQAIQEFRAAVRTGPARYDLQVALAETLFRTGELRDSAEVAQQILLELPFCIKANILLGTAWIESGLGEGKLYLERAQSLDPENALAAAMLGERSPLLRQVPRIPTSANGEGGDIEPAPILGRGKGSTEEALPRIEQALPPKMGQELAQESPPTAEALPGGKVALGEPESGQPANLEAFQFPSKRPAIPGAREALPDWVMLLVPVATTQGPVQTVPQEAARAIASAPEEMGLPSWLKQTDVETERAAEVVPSYEPSLPDWLRENPEPGQQPIADIAGTEPAIAMPTVPPTENVPDWLLAGEAAEPEFKAFTDQSPLLTPSTGVALPEWLSTPEPEETSAPPPTLSPTGETGLPTWVSDTKVEATIPAPSSEAATQADADVSLPKWLREGTGAVDLNLPAGDNPTERPNMEAENNSRADADRLALLMATGSSEGGAGASISRPSAAVEPVVPQSPEPMKAGQPPSTIDERLSWLRQLAREESATPESSPVVESPEAPADSLPAPSQEADSGQGLPDWLMARGVTEPAQPTLDPAAGELPGWLRGAPGTAAESLQEGTSPTPAQPAVPSESSSLQSPREEQDTLPSWLRAVSALRSSRSRADASSPGQDESGDAPTATSWLDQPRADRRAGDLTSALHGYETALAQAPNSREEIIADLEEIAAGEAPAMAHRVLADAYAAAGRYKESVEQYQLAVKKG